MFMIRSLKHEGQGAWDGSKMVLWWGPDRAGYTESTARAGRYQEQEAKEIIASGTPGKNVLVAEETVQRLAVGQYVSQEALNAIKAVEEQNHG